METKLTAKIFDIFTGQEIKGQALKRLQVAAGEDIHAKDPHRVPESFELRSAYAERLLKPLERKKV